MSLTAERVLFKTPINPGSGYGKDGMLLAEQLYNMGADLHLEPLNVAVPLSEIVAALLTKERPTHFEVALNHEYPGEMGFPPRIRQHADKVVGWTMYEFLGFGPDHEMTIELRERLSVFDLVLVYDEVSRSAFLEYMDEPERLQVLQGGFDADFWRPKGDEVGSRNWDGTFIYVMNGTMNRRKNPYAAISAFKQLCDELGDDFDAELHLKTTSMVFPPQLTEWCPRIKIHYDFWQPAELKKFYLKAHCLLAPSWGEGKNLPALEAQATGCPTIVSKFGGHMQWASEDWAYLVDGPIVEHAEGQGSIRVDEDVLKEKMLHVYNNRIEARLKGELASKVIPAQCDWSVVVERLKFLIDGIEPRSRF